MKIRRLTVAAGAALPALCVGAPGMLAFALAAAG
jgi:hypothetical protein